MRLTSFSQSKLFGKCNRWWWYSYIKKLPVIQDWCFANAGKTVHIILEDYYNGNTDLDVLKIEFNRLWLYYKLDTSKIKLKNDAYWSMVLKGMELKKTLTTTELKIMFPDVVAYIDGVDSKNDELCDWKSSTRTTDTDEEYVKQLKFYSYLYYRKFNRMPKKASVYYLKYSGTKGSLDFVPTDNDLIEIEDWHFDTIKEMERIVKENTVPPKCAVCDYWCPYKNLCSDNDDVLRYTLHIQGNFIQLDGVITNVINTQLTKKFSYELKDAFFIKKAKPHANTTIKFWNLNQRSLPIGFKDQLIKTLTDYAKWKNKEIAIDINDLRNFDDAEVKMPEKFLNDIVLRDYQDESVTAFFRKEVGGLQLATGAGKSEISFECIRKAGCKTLFVVDKIELLKQTKKRMEDALGIKVGQIGGGEDDIQDVTVATMQTLAKNITKYADYLSTIKFAIFDECHHAASRSIWKIGNRLTNTKYRLGLSATIKRDDGNDMMITGIVGDIIHNIGSQDLIEKGWLVKPTITFIENYMPKEKITLTEQMCKTGLLNETPNYNNFYEGFIAKNQWRNDAIKSLVDKYPNKKILILTKLIEHGKMLKEHIPNSEHLYGETPAEKREEMMNEFKNGDLNVLISTVSIWAEGLDMSSLNVIINASANKGDIRTVQMLGRVLRTLDGKENAHYYDFIDESRFFRLASYARKTALLKEGHAVKVETILAPE